MGKTADLTDRLARTLKAAQDIAAEVEAKGRDFTPEERATVTRAMDEAKGIRDELTAAKADEAMLASVKGMGAELGLNAPPKAPDMVVTSDGEKTVGEQFVTSDHYKGMLQSFPGGRIPDASGVRTAPMEAKALVTGLSSTSAGAFVRNDWLGLQVRGTFQRPLTIFDLITQAQTATDTIEWARITGFTNNAAPVPESTTTADPGAMTTANGVKPESALTLDTQTTTVKTIAHWMPVTKRALSDAGQIRALIDEFLRYGLREELEDQIVMGDGTGENLLGINSTPGVQTQAWDTDLLTTLRRARTKVRLVARRTPTAVLMNPSDTDSLALLKDTNGAYYFGGPSVAGGMQQVWGLPIVENEAVPVGFAFVGDFREAILYNREQTTIAVSDSHANFFIRNIVAILAEMRAGFAVRTPQALVKADLTAV